MLSQTTSYDRPTDNNLIDCEQQGGVAEPYPVLHIGATTIWPSREQLVAIRDAISGYLDTHPDPVEERAMNAEIVADIAADDLRAETPPVREYTDAEVQEMF